ncbi:hypothetical protein SPOG_03607 [Schizosaccharomyces cryophilus OY26]|uniref:Zn(2)-C6 fungal-type domain-containing protein n=1 Tax=Schizosaccharomyces cryophilus (strain OY26 / ATCC MYA-4695 / CBS 11777 / NBRC 106824 / NRRL Y48691) TaxID=653667 RepID=S9W3C6_SCHCR|nr:uncharacterized protein SPOG_03607 [Schizosaccharomyces cryophilus OY26]EPY53054.1 hypothetical protein SPOG_03607 [Schizosaccharomyces cryophilus OY26]
MKTSLQRPTRARKACLVCHRKKRKCSGTYPCSYCQKFRHECKYAHDAMKSKEPHNNVNYLETESSNNQSFEPNSYENTSKLVSSNNVCVPYNYETSKHVDQIMENKKGKENSKKAICFADIVGEKLGISSSWKYKPLVWNLGTRFCPRRRNGTKMKDLLSRDQCRFYVSVYFEDVNPVLELLDQIAFEEKVKMVWDNEAAEEFEALISIVVVIGSYFSYKNPLPTELELIQHAENLVNPDASSINNDPSIIKITYWILKSLYLRITADPHNAWLASCTSMHSIEMFCLYYESNERQEDFTRDKLQEYDFLPSLNKFFSIAWAFNKILCTEFGTYPLKLSQLNTGSVSFPTNLHSQPHQLIELAKLLPEGDDLIKEPQISYFATINRLSQLLKPQPIILTLLKTAICFHMYRRLILSNFHVNEMIIGIILEMTDSALDKCLILCDKGLGWWNILDIPFHGICVLLSMDTKESLQLIPKAHKVLKSVVKTFDTPASRDALHVVVILCDALKNRKINEAKLLEVEEREDITSDYGMSRSFELPVGDPFFDLFYLGHNDFLC